MLEVSLPKKTPNTRRDKLKRGASRRESLAQRMHVWHNRMHFLSVEPHIRWICFLGTESNLAEVNSILFKHAKCRQNSWRKRMRGIWPERRSQFLRWFLCRSIIGFRILQVLRDLDAYNYLLCFGHVVIKWDPELKQDDSIRFEDARSRIDHRFILIVWNIYYQKSKRERERAWISNIDVVDIVLV